MHPMEPVELRGDLVAIEPLGVEHAAGLLEEWPAAKAALANGSAAVEAR